MDDAWAWPAMVAVERLHRGEVSPRGLLASIRGRVEAVDAQVNALPTRCFERAEHFAAKLEALRPEERGRFAGLPWLIKDSAAVAGVRTTYGSLAFADHVPASSDYVVEAVEAAGGVVYAKPNTPNWRSVTAGYGRKSGLARMIPERRALYRRRSAVNSDSLEPAVIEGPVRKASRPAPANPVLFDQTLDDSLPQFRNRCVPQLETSNVARYTPPLQISVFNHPCDGKGVRRRLSGESG